MTEAECAVVRESILAVMLRGDRAGAIRESSRVLAAGMGLSQFVLEVLAPVQAQVGRQWQAGRMTHSAERLATEIAEFLLTMAAGQQTPSGDGAHLVLCVADREHHNLPARMIAELLRLEGHRVTFVGAARPGPSLTGLLEKLAPDAIVLSCSLAMNLPGLLPLARLAGDLGLPVIGGGRAFADTPVRAARLGLHAHAATVHDVTVQVAAAATVTPPMPEDERTGQFHELRAAHDQLTDELTERYLWQSDRLLSRPLRDPGHMRSYVSNLMRFTEAAVLCDEAILADYRDWMQDRFVTLRSDPAAVGALMATMHARLALDTPLAGEALALALPS